MHNFNLDEVVVITRGTLVGISTSSIGIVIDALVQLLEDLSRPYKAIQSHPTHVLQSELYILELLAECCSTHWASVNTTHSPGKHVQDTDSEGSGSEQDSSDSLNHGTVYDQKRRASRNELLARDNAPKPMADDLARRLINAIKLFLRPISENYVLPATNILDDSFNSIHKAEPLEFENGDSTNGHRNGPDASDLLHDKTDAIEAHTREIMEYVSFSNWSRALEHLKVALQQAAHQISGSSGQNGPVVDDDRNALVTIRLVSSFWVDSRKLSLVIQELCGSFLHLRKAFQTTVAIVVPLLVTRWLERNPKEFIDLHTVRKRLDGGAETLFDMANTMADGGRRKAHLFPFQSSLILLLPEVFEVASGMREIKSSSISKKVQFLETLRKTLRNRNETAIYCLTTVLRVARHFPLDSDAALLSYALDVQEEVKDAVFRRSSSGADAGIIDSSLMAAAFVSLAHLNFDSCIENLVPICTAPNATRDLKVALVTACSHFARQSNASEYQPLFLGVADFVREQLKVCPKLRFL